MSKSSLNKKIEEVNRLEELGMYIEAADAADKIQWEKIKDIKLLNQISVIYEKCGRYNEAKDVLMLAYIRTKPNKNIICRLTELSALTGDVDSAEEFYWEFRKIAPTDSEKLILAYYIICARKEPDFKKIQVLERYIKIGFDEKWAYILAQLYYSEGQIEKCVKICDELILWYGGGKYGKDALKLKHKCDRLREESETVVSEAFKSEAQKTFEDKKDKEDKTENMEKVSETETVSPEKDDEYALEGFYEVDRFEELLKPAKQAADNSNNSLFYDLKKEKDEEITDEFTTEPVVAAEDVTAIENITTPENINVTNETSENFDIDIEEYADISKADEVWLNAAETDGKNVTPVVGTETVEAEDIAAEAVEAEAITAETETVEIIEEELSVTDEVELELDKVIEAAVREELDLDEDRILKFGKISTPENEIAAASQKRIENVEDEEQRDKALTFEELEIEDYDYEAEPSLQGEVQTEQEQVELETAESDVPQQSFDIEHWDWDSMSKAAENTDSENGAWSKYKVIGYLDEKNVFNAGAPVEDTLRNVGTPGKVVPEDMHRGSSKSKKHRHSSKYGGVKIYLMECTQMRGGVKYAANRLRNIHKDEGTKLSGVARISDAKFSIKGAEESINVLKGRDLVVEGVSGVTYEAVNEMLRLLDEDRKTAVVVLLDTPTKLALFVNRHRTFAEKCTYIYEEAAITRTEFIEYVNNYASMLEAALDDTADEALEEIADEIIEDGISFTASDAAELAGKAIDRAMKPGLKGVFEAKKNADGYLILRARHFDRG